MFLGILQTTVNIKPKLGIGTFFQITSVGSLISGILSASLTAASLAFIIYFVWGAMRWLTAGGDKNTVELARQKITNALIGLVLIAAAWAIYLIVIYVLGLGGIIETKGMAAVGNSNCPCPTGGCASTGQTNRMGGVGVSACYTCQATGWNGPVGGACSVLTCNACP
jgi:hypothetical protein